MNESRQIIVRSFSAELAEGDGRTIVGRCVPYGEVAEVPGEGNGPYREMFQRGAFRRAVKAPHKVILDFEHREDPLSVLGHGVELVERDDGLHGVFRALDGAVGDQGLEMVRAGLLRGMSVRAMVLGPGRRRADGVVVRTACHLDRVALCREPAYAGAVIEALRATDPAVEPAALAELRPPPNVELDAKIRALRERGVLPSPT
jgi:HK97 family phage prohead protease